MYLFDTDVLSNIVKTKPSSGLLQKLRKIPSDMQFTTAINAAEIYYGASKSVHRESIIQAFEEKVFPNLLILPFDEGSAKIYGTTKARLEKKGLSASEPDLRIASIAIQHRLTLITGNVRHFKSIPGLVIENWIKNI